VSFPVFSQADVVPDDAREAVAQRQAPSAKAQWSDVVQPDVFTAPAVSVGS
jgi:hypothetical protein